VTPSQNPSVGDDPNKHGQEGAQQQASMYEAFTDHSASLTFDSAPAGIG
jgi:hypothetical protein